jgi:hypothetical protein
LFGTLNQYSIHKCIFIINHFKSTKKKVLKLAKKLKLDLVAKEKGPVISEKRIWKAATKQKKNRHYILLKDKTKIHLGTKSTVDPLSTRTLESYIKVEKQWRDEEAGKR